MFTNLLPSEFLCSTTDVRQWAVENSVYHHVWFTASSMPDKLKDNSGSFSMRALLWGLLVSKTSASTCFFQILRKEGVWPPRLFSSTRLFMQYHIASQNVWNKWPFFTTVCAFDTAIVQTLYEFVRIFFKTKRQRGDNEIRHRKRCTTSTPCYPTVTITLRVVRREKKRFITHLLTWLLTRHNVFERVIHLGPTLCWSAFFLFYSFFF